MEQKIVKMAKLTFATKHFNQNQKVWLQITTGAMAAKVCGRRKGKERYISTWINWDKKGVEDPVFNDIKVSSDFAERHRLYAV